MFILRTVTESNKQLNQVIGNTYAVVERHSNYPEFKDLFKDLFGVDHVADLDDTATETSKKCYAFIQSIGELIPLYMDNNYYLMTDSGKTFSNITYKLN